MEILQRKTLEEIAHILDLKKSQVANIRQGKRDLSALEVIRLWEADNYQYLNFFSWQKDDLLFWEHLEKLQSLIAKNDQQMSELFNLSQRQYRFHRSITHSLPWSACQHFENRFQIFPVMWFSNDLDLDCVAKNILSPFQSHAYLPIRFEGGGSKMRSFSNTIDYVQTVWGEECARALMQAMQITRESLNFSEKNISIKVFSIVHQKLRMYGAQDHHFVEMGAFNRVNRKIKRMLSQAIPSHIKDRHLILKYSIDNLTGKVDINQDYKVLSATEKMLVIQCQPTNFFKEAFLPEKPFSQYEVALFVQGHFQVSPTYFDFPEFSKIDLHFDEETSVATYYAHF